MASWMAFSRILFILSMVTICHITAIVIPDEERREGFAARNYSWPIPDEKMVPTTPGWNRRIRRRIRQVEAMETDNRIEKYDAWVSVMEQALVVPNFTQYGWAVSKAPTELVQELQTALQAGFESAVVEGDDPAIVVESQELLPVMAVLQDELIHKALQELLPYHEAWAGIPLKPQTGYGLRIYRNTSQLYMHLDKVESHVISCIFHIDRSDDSKPWPLVIEDLEGMTQHIYLNKGDLLFYESAKCLHGRPIPLDAGWYTSLFLHYSPLDWPFEEQNWAPQYAIPDHWEERHPYTEEEEKMLPRIKMMDTAIIEPECPHTWCAADSAKIWQKETKFGIAMSSHGEEQVLHLLEEAKDGEEL